MNMQDPIADMLTRIRNALSMNKKNVAVPKSKIKVEIAKVMQSEGFINGFSVSDEIRSNLVIDLKYFQGKPVIENLTRISKPSLKVYKSKEELPKVNNGLGIAIVSTSKGVCSDREAKKNGVGGEILCTVF